MRILYLHRTQGEEPESIHIGAIVTALRKLGHEVRIVGPAKLDGHATRGEQRSSLRNVKRIVPAWVFELLQLGYNAVIFWNLWRAVRSFQPDFIYERYALYSFAGVLVAHWTHTPLILEVNTPYAQAWAKFFGLRFERLARSIEGRTFRAANHVVTVTHIQAEMLIREGVDPDRLTVCHNAIDPAWFDPEAAAVGGLRDKLALKGIVVGFVGTMNRWQGIPEFPDVIEQVFAQCSDVSFLFVGDGEFRSSFERECRDRGFMDRVHFAGRRSHDEIPKFVEAMDIAVLLNSNDYGSPMKIFEYLGMGKAVIAPAVGPVLEILQDGTTGLLIPPGDALAMSRRIVELVHDQEQRRRLGRQGRSYVLDNHTWKRNAERVIEAHARLTLDRS